MVNVNIFNKEKYFKASAENIKKLVAEAKANKGFSNDETLCKDIKKKTGYYFARQTLKNYCEGKTRPSVEAIVPLCQYFDVPADYIVGITDTRTKKKPSKDEEELRAVCDYLGLNEKTVKVLNLSSSDILEFIDFVICETFKRDIETIIHKDAVLLGEGKYKIENKYLYNAIARQKELKELEAEGQRLGDDMESFSKGIVLKHQYEDIEERLNGNKQVITKRFVNLLDIFIERKGVENDG